MSKSLFLNAFVCPGLGWMIRHEKIKEKPVPLGVQFRMEQGLDIQFRSRKLYPNGVLISDRDIISASLKTKQFMNNPTIQVIFEGTFFLDDYITKADILKRNSNSSWHMFEVKSSVRDKEEFIDDMAYTTMVMLCCGVNISDIFLILISRDFRLGMNNEDLFIEINHTDEVLKKVEIFMPYWKKLNEITKNHEKPENDLIYECKKCDIFKECLGKNIKNHIFDLPYLNQSKFLKLKQSSIFSIENIPNTFSLTPKQNIVKESVKMNKIYIEKKIKSILESISWPTYYLDFETVMTAIPLFPNISPYYQLPTQYSIHKCSEPGKIIDHIFYLADPNKDCRREISKNLIKDLRGDGSIIHYTNIEKTIINRLKVENPGLSSEFDNIIKRLVDLNAIINKYIYHPEFHGSTSIKNVLPVLVPNMSYNELKIQDGDSAMAVFAYLAQGKYSNAEAKSIKMNLLEYCKHDTLAELKLHYALCDICNKYI